jgi:hypothetical protein
MPWIAVGRLALRGKSFLPMAGMTVLKFAIKTAELNGIRVCPRFAGAGFAILMARQSNVWQ